jgi:hypothetical protein
MQTTAIAEAERRVAAAEQQEQVESGNARLERARELAAEVTAKSRDLDSAAKKFFAQYDAFREFMFELYRLGFTPQINLIDTASRRALITHSMGTRLQIEHLAPGERHSFSDWTSRWTEHLTKKEAA